MTHAAISGHSLGAQGRQATAQSLPARTLYTRTPPYGQAGTNPDAYHGAVPLPNLSKSHRQSKRRMVQVILHGHVARRLFAVMLRRAFPGGGCDAERARRGAPVLEISERHFLRLLNAECDASLPQVLAVFVLLFGEVALSMIYGRERE